MKWVNQMTEQRAATQKEQLNEIKDAIETVIIQAAEISGLRNWLIMRHFLKLKPGQWPNGEMIVQGDGEGLIQAFEAIIDPDDMEFFNSNWAKECATARGIDDLEQLVYESAPI